MESQKLVRGRVIRALAGKVGGFAVLTLTLFVDLTVVDHLVFVHWRGREEHDQIVPVLRFDLSVGVLIQICQPDVVDAYPHIVLLAPGLDVGVVEPGIVAWHEVLPLQDLQRFGLGPNPARDNKTHPQTCC